jgi:hypothetical protein
MTLRAAEHKRTVVHYDADFEIAAEVVESEHRWVLPRETVQRDARSVYINWCPRYDTVHTHTAVGPKVTGFGLVHMGPREPSVLIARNGRRDYLV